MTAELIWLTFSAALTGVLWIPYILVRGPLGAMANPSPIDKPQSPWARRMMAAHANAVENLAVFAPLVLVAHALNISTPLTVFACALYFWSRLAYLIVYTAGVPVLRTVSFVGGFAAQAILALVIFGLI